MDSSCITAGWLEKQGALNKAWKRRWCVLRKSRLDYYQVESETKPTGSIFLANSTVTYTVDDDEKKQTGLGTLEIFSPSQNRTFYLRTTLDGVHKWHSAISKMTDAKSAALVGLTPYKDGYLEKKGVQHTAWKSRYFVLFSDRLDYSDSPSGSVKGSIPLIDARIQLVPGKHASEVYLEITPVMSERVFQLHGSPAYLQEWIDAIRSSIQVRRVEDSLVNAETRKANRRNAELDTLKKSNNPLTASTAQDIVKLKQEKEQIDESRRHIDLEIPDGGMFQLQALDQQHEVEARDRALKELEADVVELNGLFRQTALLVHEQGEKLNDLEAHMDNALALVDGGLGELQKIK